ncbi:bcl-2-binding component 3-like [Hippopotamus amphibius kiboko]|uniref:bcl-2-binding component 3-like n=1 Tax=Hippopotamus amphibius kiboko TaxID=575201 RepID=UPI002591D139|nr:bcl-2-binding component 3-like [Hippopotamus amphibius kiboko]
MPSLKAERRIRPGEPRRSGRRAWLAPHRLCAPSAAGVAAALGPPGWPAARAPRVASPLPGSERTPTPRCRRRRRGVPAARPGRSPTRPGLRPPARAPPALEL